MNDTLEKLSKLENFQSWSVGGIETALTRAREMATLSKLGSSEIPQADDPRWADEPDKVQWIDPTTGLDCLIVRNQMGALCGYVGAPPGHPFHGVDYGSCTKTPPCEESRCDHTPEQMLSVHGGITFSDFCAPEEGPEAICHVPAPGRPDHVYWFGFDCAHGGCDVIPGMTVFGSMKFGTYRDLDYVVDQVTALAVQIKARS